MARVQMTPTKGLSCESVNFATLSLHKTKFDGIIKDGTFDCLTIRASYFGKKIL